MRGGAGAGSKEERRSGRRPRSRATPADLGLPSPLAPSSAAAGRPPRVSSSFSRRGRRRATIARPSIRALAGPPTIGRPSFISPGAAKTGAGQRERRRPPPRSRRAAAPRGDASRREGGLSDFRLSLSALFELSRARLPASSSHQTSLGPLRARAWCEISQHPLHADVRPSGLTSPPRSVFRPCCSPQHTPPIIGPSAPPPSPPRTPP